MPLIIVCSSLQWVGWGGRVGGGLGGGGLGGGRSSDFSYLLRKIKLQFSATYYYAFSREVSFIGQSR